MAIGAGPRPRLRDLNFKFESMCVDVVTDGYNSHINLQILGFTRSMRGPNKTQRGEELENYGREDGLELRMTGHRSRCC